MVKAKGRKRRLKQKGETTMANFNVTEINSNPCSVFTTQPISLAMAYVPFQQWRNLYDPELGFERATIFAELDKPFIGEEAVPRA